MPFTFCGLNDFLGAFVKFSADIGGLRCNGVVSRQDLWICTFSYSLEIELQRNESVCLHLRFSVLCSEADRKRLTCCI